MRRLGYHGMLVICRKPGEQFVIGNNVKVTVRRVQGNRVWLGFDAPRSIPIDREELLRPERGLKVFAEADPSSDNSAERTANPET